MMNRIPIWLLMFLVPRFLPPVLRFLRLVWRLIFDKRVHLVLRALVPLAILYALSPLDLISDKFGYLGKFDDLLVLGLAVLLLTKLAPRHVVDEHLGNLPKDDRPQEKDPSKVVEGTSHLLDEE